MLLDDRYLAEARIVVQPQGDSSVDIGSVLSGVTTDVALETEVELLRAPTLAMQVINALDLRADPDLNRYLGVPRDTGTSEEAFAAREDAALLDRFLERLRVDPIGSSHVVSVRFWSHNPEQAARVANATGNAYIEAQVRSKAEAAMQASDWLEQRIVAVSTEVREAEQAVEQFREDSGLLESRGVFMTSQQISELNTQLVLARAERAQAQARLTNVRELMRDGGDDARFPLQSAHLDSLRQALGDNEREVAELSAEYGDRHPRMINLRARGADLRAQVAAEQRKLVNALESAVSVATTRELSLNDSLSRLSEKVASLNQEEVSLRALERDAAASGALLQELLARAKEAGSRTDLTLQKADAAFVSTASVPLEPSFPPRLALLALALIGGLSVGVMLAFVIDHFVTGFRREQEVRRLTGLPCLALIPARRLAWPWQRRSLPHARHVGNSPHSPFTDAVRELYCNAVLLPMADHSPKSLLVTSASPGEGKSTLAASLAVLQAQAGMKVLLIDGDLRNPDLHRAFGLRNEPGLSNLLDGSAELADCLALHGDSGVHVLSAGERRHAAPAELFSSAGWRELLQHVREHFDLVVIDSAPVRAGPDSRILARTVDSTVMVTRWASTPKDAVLDALAEMYEAGASVAGIALSHVDLDRLAHYEHGARSEYLEALSRA